MSTLIQKKAPSHTNSPSARLGGRQTILPHLFFRQISPTPILPSIHALSLSSARPPTPTSVPTFLQRPVLQYSDKVPVLRGALSTAPSATTCSPPAGHHITTYAGSVLTIRWWWVVRGTWLQADWSVGVKVAHHTLQSRRNTIAVPVHGAGSLARATGGGLGVEVLLLGRRRLLGIGVHRCSGGKRWRRLLDHGHRLASVGSGGIGGVGWWCALMVGAIHVLVECGLLLCGVGRTCWITRSHVGRCVGGDDGSLLGALLCSLPGKRFGLLLLLHARSR